jgi:hypothetical protein
MKLSIALRTCSGSFNYWNSDRIVNVDKETIILTCLNSLLKSLVNFQNSFSFSIHDDSSNQDVLDRMKNLCDEHKVDVEIINSGKFNNFKTQYEWCKNQECEYVYCVEDDYLHTINALTEMIDMCDYVKKIMPNDYAIYPFNSPHRYNSIDMLYPSYVLKGKTQYWRSSFHSSHTFLVSKKSFNEFDDIMRYQAYNWPSLNAVEDKTINLLWQKHNVRLLTPISHCAIHLADKTQEDTLYDWEKLWKDNLI